MTFWKNNGVEPVRKFRFKVLMDEFWWWVQTADKPSFEVGTNEYLLTNHKFKIPGVLTWNDISITMVDSGQKASKVLKFLEKSGYIIPSSMSQLPDGLAKRGVTGDKSTNLKIFQYDGKGKPLETWTLFGAFINSTNFGDLDYGSDDLVTLTLGISYDYATLDSDQIL